MIGNTLNNIKKQNKKKKQKKNKRVYFNEIIWLIIIKI